MAGRKTSPPWAGGQWGPHADTRLTAPAPGLSPSPPPPPGSCHQPCPPLLPQWLHPARPAGPLSPLNLPGAWLWRHLRPKGVWSGKLLMPHNTMKHHVWEEVVGYLSNKVLTTSPGCLSSLGPTWRILGFLETPDTKVQTFSPQRSPKCPAPLNLLTPHLLSPP